MSPGFISMCPLSVAINEDDSILSHALYGSALRTWDFSRGFGLGASVFRSNTKRLSQLIIDYLQILSSPRYSIVCRAELKSGQDWLVTTEISRDAQDDGLYYEDEVGPWVEDKHSLVSLYETLFSTGMKRKWDVRVYIDLYSGPGIVRVRGSGKFLWGSPLLALQTKNPFDKYIFCESNDSALDALELRVKRFFPNADVCYVRGNCNETVEEICGRIPTPSRDRKVLSFCFVDPYDLSVKFSTITKIADTFVDFLTLLALGMDANRNLQHYLDPSNKKIDEFLGLPDWRDRWLEQSSQSKISLPRFLAEMYAKQMKSLNYLPVAFHQMKQIRSDVNNLPLYHLALFSRHNLAYKYWDDVLKYGTSQLSLGI
jgi:three-Cys-motif partner protein